MCGLIKKLLRGEHNEELKNQNARLQERLAELEKDRRFEEVQIPPRAEGGIAMCEVLDRVEKRGFDLGHHGGFISGQNNILALAKRMIASGRIDDLSRTSMDSEYLTKLLKEEGLQTEA